MSKSKVEEFCKAQFDEFIKSSLEPNSIYWEDVPQKEEPPDYYLYLDNRKYAVEVTTLMEKKSVGEAELPLFAILGTLSRIVKDIERRALFQGILKGAYIIDFSLPITDLSRIRERLKKELLEYIKTTKSKTSAPEKTIFKHNRQRCTIEKKHDKKDYVGMMGPHDAKWERDIIIEACGLIQERINEKFRLLSGIQNKKILLLYNAYGFAEQEIFRACLDELTHLDFFHMIFIIGSEGSGWIFYIRDKD